VAKSPLFCVNYIYLLNFLSQLISEKSGKVGRKPSNPHEYWVSPSPFLFLKVGRKWANGHFFLKNVRTSLKKFTKMVTFLKTLTVYLNNRKSFLFRQT
jgi:hypothetical protein